MEKILRKSFELNFTPNTSGSCGLTESGPISNSTSRAITIPPLMHGKKRRRRKHVQEWYLHVQEKGRVRPFFLNLQETCSAVRKLGSTSIQAGIVPKAYFFTNFTRPRINFNRKK